MWACCRLLDPEFTEAGSEEDGHVLEQQELQQDVAQPGLAASVAAAPALPNTASVAAADATSHQQDSMFAQAPGDDAAAMGAKAGTSSSTTTTAPSEELPWHGASSGGFCHVTFLQLLLGFQPPCRESLYLGFKQRRYVFLDVASGAFTGAYLASVVGRMVRDRDAWTGLPVAAVMLAKLLPYCVLLASKPAFFRYREVLVVVPELLKVFAIMLGMLGVLPLPRKLLAALSRSRGDVVVTGVIRPLLQHLRFRWHLSLVLLEAVAMPCLFHAVVGSWRAVLPRFAVSYGLSLAVGAAFDLAARRQFVAQLMSGKGVKAE